MKAFTYFWGTFAFLLFMGCAGLCRALLWGSPAVTCQDAGSFQCTLNGLQVQGNVWNAKGTTEETADLLEAEWATEGWQPVGDGFDFFPTLLEIGPLNPEVQEALRQCVQIRFFKRSNILKILGILRTEGGQNVSGLVVELPEEALNAQNMDAQDSSAPAEAPPYTKITQFGAEALHFSVWCLPSTPATPDSLQPWCQSHGVSLKPWPNSSSTNHFIAKRLHHQWFLNIEHIEGKKTWVWVSLPDEGIFEE